MAAAQLLFSLEKKLVQLALMQPGFTLVNRKDSVLLQEVYTPAYA